MGSTGLNLRATTTLVLTPRMGVQLVELDFKGPLNLGTVGLLIGRSSATLRGLRVHPGVIDPDYTGIVKIMVESPKGISAISPGDRIVQLILLPSLHGRFEACPAERGNRGFVFSGTDLTFLSLDLDQQPVLTLKVDGKCILGLLDTGADKSIIAKKDWPSGWPIQASSQTLQGLGYAKAPDMSARQLQLSDDESHSGSIQPYVLELPISLWGRDLLKDMGFKLSNEYSPASQQMMTKMGYHPSLRKARRLEGQKDPISL